MTDHIALYPPGGGAGGGSFSAGVSTLGNTAGTTGTVSNQVVFVGSNNITLSQSSAAGGATVSILGGAGGAGFSGGVSNLGNTAGSTGVTGTRLVLAGTNMVSLSQSTDANGGTVSINATQSLQTQGVLSVGLSNIGNTAGNTTVNTGSRLVLSGQANITLSQATAAGATTIGMSVPSQSVQTQNVVVPAASNTTYTSGTVVFTGVNNITVATNGQTISISGPTTAAQTNQTGSVFAISNTTGTSSGTYDARTLSIAGAGIVSVAASNSGFRISASQSVQTENRFNLTLSGNTDGVMAQVSSGTLTLAGGANITLSQAGNAISIIGGAGGGGAGMSAGLSTGGNTSGDTGAVTGRLILVGGNNLTLSGSTNAGSMTITFSAPNLGAGAMSAGASNLGNTAGSTGITGTQLVLVGSGVMSLSQSTGANGGTVSILAPATSSLSATGQVSISTNGSTISIGVPNKILSMWPMAIQSTALSAVTATASLFATAATRTTMTSPVFPLPIEEDLSVNMLKIPAQLSATTTVTSQNFSYTAGQSFGLYSLNGASLSLVSSFSNQIRLSVASATNSTQGSATFAMSYGSGTNLSSSTSLTTGNVYGNTSFWSSVSNTKIIPFASGNMSVSGSQYFGIYVVSQKTGGSNLMSLSQVGVNAAVSGVTVPSIGKAIASTTGRFPLMGFVSMTQTDTGLPSAIATSNITLSSNASSWVNRSVALQFQSQFYAE